MDSILFDLDDTLYDQAQPFALAYRQVIGERITREGRPLDAEALFRASRRYSDAAFAASERGEIPMDAMYIYRLQTAFRDFGLEVDGETCLAMQHAYAYNQEHAITLFPGVPALLDWCCAHTLVGVVTNGPGAHQLAKVKALGLERWIAPEHVLVSSLEGVAKPDPAIYLRACERLGAAAKRSVFVGDSFGMDIAGAEAAGMVSVWFNHRRRASGEGSQPSHTVCSLDELFSLLKRL